MKDIKIGEILSEKRKEKGVTQEEVAEYIGVSKAAVSKWENGLSYPDITVLPLLATYFHISIDQLIGYKPQLDDREIRKKYQEFSGKFAEEPFLRVVEEIREFIRKYDACYPLLFMMAQLYLNNCMLAPGREEGSMVLEEAALLCRRVQRESGDTLLKKDALSMEALICLMQKKPDRVLKLLGNKVKPLLPSEQFIISAYQMLGEKERAMKYDQAVIYTELISMLDNLSIYFRLGTEEQKEECLLRVEKFVEAFSLNQLLPHKTVSFYYAKAAYFMERQREDEALKALEEYLKVIEHEWKNFCIHGNKFFENLEEWAEESGMNTTMPRDLRLVRRELVVSVTDNPVFAPLKEKAEYKRIERQLKSFAEESQKGDGGRK